MKKIYINGTILTMDENNPEVEALCLENGRITHLGKSSDVLNLVQEGDEVIDLSGKTMIPGFIDPHSHFVGFANSLSQCDLSEAKSFSDIISLMKKFITDEKIPEGQYVYGSHYDHNFFEEKRHPDKFVLDQISTKHPILITHASSHMGVCNSLALELHHIDASTQDIEGGKYGRVSGSSEPNGYMEENVYIEFQKSCPMIPVERLFSLMQKAQDIYASYGITTIQDGMVNEQLFQLLEYASANHLLKQDVVAFLDLAHCQDLMHQKDNYTKDYIGHLKIGGYKTFLDGSPQGRTAWLTFPYKCSEDYYGYPILTDEVLYNQILVALKDKKQVLAHCNGDGAAEQYITQFEKVLADYPELESCRPVMIHAQLCRKDQLKRMPNIQMMPSFFVAHTYYWGDIHIENFGYEVASNISAAKTAERLHIPYTFHQDTPVLRPDMMKTVWCACNRITQNGVKLNQDECLSIQEALKAITIYPAYQYFEENEKGMLRVGYKADLVILDSNPLLADVKKVDQVKVLETIKEGQTIYHC